MTGSGAHLMPEGITSIEHMTWDLAHALQFASRVCNWQENLQRDEMPPDWMLPHDEELELHFAEVDRLRKEKYGVDDSDESSEMMSNSLSERFRR